MKFEYAFFHEAGIGMPEQQAYSIVNNPADDKIVCVFACGKGKEVSSTYAAATVILETEESLANDPDILDESHWTTVLSKIDKKIAKEKPRSKTTGLVLALTEKGIAGASVGDSVAWIVRDSGIQELDVEHSTKKLLGQGAEPASFSFSPLDGTLFIVSKKIAMELDQEKFKAIVLEKSKKVIFENGSPRPVTFYAHNPETVVRLVSGLLRSSFYEADQNITFIMVRPALG